MTNVIAQVVRDNLCTGCGACAGMFNPPAAAMKLSVDGFLRPEVLRSITEHELADFEQVCPGIGLRHKEQSTEYDPLWGNVKVSAAGYATDPETRFKGSSGGVISALAIHLLESGSVDGVLHIVPSEDNAFENVAQLSRSRDEVLRAAGSRYAPAAPLTLINECLNESGVFAFVGKPCDVAALRALTERRIEVKRKFPYLISFMCAGTPSMRGTEAVVRRLGFEPEHVVQFRYRGNGWPGMARATAKDGRVGEMSYDSSWGQILNRHLQFRCKICPDGTGEFSDITCADAWYGNEKGYPTFVEQDGRSLILVRTPAGNSIFQSAFAAGRLKFDILDIGGLEKMQPYQAERKRMVLARILGLALAFRATPKFSRLKLFALMSNSGVIPLFRNAVGMWARARGLK